MALQMVESARLIVADLTAAREGSAELAIRHRKTLMAGRTHASSPSTPSASKVAGWVAELDRSIGRLRRAATKPPSAA